MMMIKCRMYADIVFVYVSAEKECVITSLCVLAGSCGRVSSTVANNVLNARPTS